MKFDGRIAVFGGRFISEEIYKDTLEIGKRMAEKNWLVFCGGGEGVMEAIAKGVSLGGGTCIGILKDKDFKNQVLSMIPLGRLGEVEDLMGPFVFLASEASSMMTGSSVLVDGGWTSR